MRPWLTRRGDRVVILADADAVPTDSQVGTRTSKRDASKALFSQLTSDLSPCLSGCGSAANRERDLSDSLGGHVCAVEIGTVNAPAYPAGQAVRVSVFRWIGPTGETMPVSIEITGPNGEQPDELSALGAAALAALLAKAADFAKAVAR